MKISTLTAKATGQWQNIIHSLTGTELQKNKHSPCPVCGGKDRFRFDDLDGRGTYICNQCGAGDGLSLLSKIKGVDLSSAASELADYLRLPSQNARAYAKIPQTNQKENPFLGKLNQAILGVSDYFKGKGLDYPLLMENSTALVPLINIEGTVTGIQSISSDGAKRYGAGHKKKSAFYVVTCSQKREDHLCFRLPATLNREESQDFYPDIIISEGIATALTTKLLYPRALCIAALDSGNLLPVAQALRNKYPGNSIVIAADNDAHLSQNVGVIAAQKSANAIKGDIAIPPSDDKADWNDLYLRLLDKGLDKKEVINTLRNDFLESIKKGKNLDFSDIVGDAELADGTKLSNEELVRLRGMNQTFTQVLLPDGGLYYHKRIDPISGLNVFTHDRPRAFVARYNHMPRIARRNAARAWDSWAGKNIKPDGVGFYPDVSKCPETVLNLFDGFAIAPLKGDCTPYLNHIEQVICSGDKEAYHCFISWAAHMIQKPDEKPSFAVVLISEQGAGKGTAVEPLLKILGAFGVYQNGIDRITGRFNSTIANKLLVFVDEVHISKVRDADTLKSLISEPVVSLEQKGLDPIQMPNYARFIFASNRADAIKTGIMERRYLVLETSNQYAQDKTYFDGLWQWLNHNGASYLLHYLQHLNISQFDPRRAVQTNALKNLVIANLTGVDGFVYDQLTSDNPFNYLANYGRIKARELVSLYIAWVKESGGEITSPRARREIGFMMSNIFQANKTGRSGRGEGVIYELPDIDTMIQRFAGIRLRMGNMDALD